MSVLSAMTGRDQHEEDIIEKCVQFGHELPDFVKEIPEVLPGLEFILEAFLELSTTRPSGFGLSRIPWTAIRQYSNDEGLTGEDREHFEAVIRSLDASYVLERGAKSNGDTGTVQQENARPVGSGG
jgi:hypothetical protein